MMVAFRGRKLLYAIIRASIDIDLLDMRIAYEHLLKSIPFSSLAISYTITCINIAIYFTLLHNPVKPACALTYALISRRLKPSPVVAVTMSISFSSL